MSDSDLYGNLLAIKDRYCLRFLVQIQNGHGTKACDSFETREQAEEAADRLVKLGWSAAIVKRLDTLLEMRGKNPPAKISGSQRLRKAKAKFQADLKSSDKSEAP